MTKPGGLQGSKKIVEIAGLCFEACFTNASLRVGRGGYFT